MTGGQSIPMFDYYLAPYVAKSFVRNCGTFLELFDLSMVIDHVDISDLTQICEEKTRINQSPDYIKHFFIGPMDNFIDGHGHILDEAGRMELEDMFDSFIHRCIHAYAGKDAGVYLNASSIMNEFTKMWDFALKRTERDTYQAMEATVHNLCTLSSRAGGQVPFSSVNMGTDTSEEGRMVTRNLFLATEAGLGSGETAVFPISIMKMKKGVTDKGSPNYDLFQLACRVSSKRLFPKQHWGLCVAV